MDGFAEAGGDEGGAEAERRVLAVSAPVNVLDKHVAVAEVTLRSKLLKSQKTQNKRILYILMDVALTRRLSNPFSPVRSFPRPQNVPPPVAVPPIL